jgi:hypothetical protein
VAESKAVVAKKQATAKKATRLKPVVEASRKLTPQQRVYIRCLLDAGLDKGKAYKLFEKTGVAADRSTVWRWWSRPKFVEAYEVILAAELARMGITRSQILANVAMVAEDAMAGDEVFFKGEPTGEIRKDRGAALKALKMLGETAEGGRIWSEDGRGQTVVNFNIDFSTPPKFGAEPGQVVEAEYEVVEAPHLRNITDAQFGEEDLSFLE